LLGASIAGFFQLRNETLKRRYERASLAVAFATELKVHGEAVKVRRQDESARSFIAQLRAGQIGTEEVGGLIGSFLAAGDDVEVGLPIWKEFRKDIGRLGVLAEPVSAYYSRILMIRETIQSFRRGEYAVYPPLQLADIIEEELRLWAEAQSFSCRCNPKAFCNACGSW
jgi:hypothetical protein